MKIDAEYLKTFPFEDYVINYLKEPNIGKPLSFNMKHGDREFKITIEVIRKLTPNQAKYGPKYRVKG